MEPFIFYTNGINAKSEFDEENNIQRYFIEGHVTTSDLDLVNDVVTKECMDDLSAQFKTRSVKLDFDHETLRGNNEFEKKIGLTKIPLGKAVSEIKDEKGNRVQFELNPTWKKFDEKGNVVMTFEDIWKNIQNKFYDAYSIAYIPQKTTNKSLSDGNMARLLDKVNLVNVALTGNPINPNATIRNVMAKSLEWMQENEKTKSEVKMADDEKEKQDKLKEEEDKKAKKKAEEEEGQRRRGKEEEDEKKCNKKADDEEEEKKKKADEEEDEKEEKKEKKSLEKIEKLEKELLEVKSIMAELKSFIEAPRMKSIGAENKSDIQAKSTPVSNIKGPLDLI